MACLQIYRELLSLTTFLRVHSNSKEVSYLSWQNTYHNLKTTCHIKLKYFLWTKLLENLLLAKYLISVAAPSRHDLSNLQERKFNYILRHLVSARKILKFRVTTPLFTLHSMPMKDLPFWMFFGTLITVF